jgi:hypothetical protein
MRSNSRKVGIHTFIECRPSLLFQDLRKCMNCVFVSDSMYYNRPTRPIRSGSNNRRLLIIKPRPNNIQRIHKYPMV